MRVTGYSRASRFISALRHTGTPVNQAMTAAAEIDADANAQIF
jgi:hypothetical protein